MVEIRIAEPADADDIAAAHIDGWRVGYRNLLPDEYLDAPSFAQQRIDRWRMWTWADGLAGVTLDLDAAAAADLFALARTCWAEARRPAPLITTSFFFALDDGDGSARAQVHRHLRHYMNWLPPSLVDAMAPTTGFAGTAAELRDVLRRFEDAGADEVHLIPTGSAVRQVHEVADVVR